MSHKDISQIYFVDKNRWAKTLLSIPLKEIVYPVHATIANFRLTGSEPDSLPHRLGYIWKISVN